MEQIPFPFSLETAFIFDNFYDATGHVIKRMQAVSSQPQFIHLVGGVATGKSHLLQAVCHQAKAEKKTASYIPMEQFMDLPVDALIFDNQFDVICVDDIDKAAGNLEWERRLFVLFNAMHDASQTLVFSSKQPAPAFVLPDLASRMKLLEMVPLTKPSDKACMQSLLCHAKSRGMRLDNTVLSYMLRHLPRNMHHLMGILDKLESLSLVDKKKVTVAMVKRAL